MVACLLKKMFWKYSWVHVLKLKSCFSQVKLAFSEEVAFIQADSISMISQFLFRFSPRITGGLLLLQIAFVSFWKSPLLGNSLNRAFFNRLRLILYSNSVYVYFAVFTR